MNGNRGSGLSAATLLSLLVGHELDAVARHEWRILPGLASLDDTTGLAVFVLLHVPLFLGLSWGIFVAAPSTRRLTRVGLGGFMVVHVALHYALEKPGVSTFDPWWSRVLIFGAAIAGVWTIVANRTTGR